MSHENKDLRGEEPREQRPKGRRSMRTAENLRKRKSKKWKNSSIFLRGGKGLEEP